MISKVLISSDECYSAELKNGESAVGHYLDLSSDSKVIKSSIELDDIVWFNKKTKLRNVLDKAILQYQKQYKVVVSKIAMIGDIYKSNDILGFGKLANSSDNPIDHLGNCDLLEVVVNEDDEIEIHFEDADIRGEIKLYLISIQKLKRITSKKFSSMTIGDYRTIQSDSSALKYTSMLVHS